MKTSNGTDIQPYLKTTVIATVTVIDGAESIEIAEDKHNFGLQAFKALDALDPKEFGTDGFRDEIHSDRVKVDGGYKYQKSIVAPFWLWKRIAAKFKKPKAKVKHKMGRPATGQGQTVYVPQELVEIVSQLKYYNKIGKNSELLAVAKLLDCLD